MKTENIKPSKALVIDVECFTHVCQAGMVDTLLVSDLKRMGGMDALDKAFRTTYFCARMALSFVKGGFTVDQKAADWAFEAYQKANIAAKGDKPKRNKAEEAAYNAAKNHFKNWRQNVGFPAVQSRTDKAKAETKAKAKAAATEKLAKAREKDLMAPIPAALTPTANTAVTADRFMRQQTAMLLAYCDKNKALIPDAMRHAVAELAECMRAVPVACPDDPEDDASA